jgi:hypothetical protein
LDRVFAPGLYPLEAMARAPGDARRVEPPASGISARDAIERAKFLVFEPGCHEAPSASASNDFEVLAVRGRATLFVRRQVTRQP